MNPSEPIQMRRGNTALLERPAPPIQMASDAQRIEQLEAELSQYRAMLQLVVEVTSAAAQGNLEPRLLRCDNSVKFRDVARSINHLLDMTDAFLREVGAALDHASHGKFFRRVVLRGMRGTFRQTSGMINATAERMGKSAASVNKVEQLISDSANIARNAVREASETSAVVQGLDAASERIASVIKSISQIAWQTKLLAFNAKVEASRAGEAGRGFDVVALEVKELAQQTAAATEGISREITSMRQEVVRTARAIDSMTATIGQLQQISADIERAIVDRAEHS